MMGRLIWVRRWRSCGAKGMQAPITLSLTALQIEFLQSCGREMLAGASATGIRRIFPGTADEIATLMPLFATESATDLVLPESDWRKIYDMIHAVIYGLGSSELQTLTGLTLTEAVNTNLTIASQIWGVYGGARF